MIDAALLAACLSFGTDPALVFAIIAQESAGKPAALNVNGWDGDPFTTNDDIDASVIAANGFVELGYSVDIGLMGINSVNIDRFDLTIAHVYDPCTNIATGERILLENLETAASAGLVGFDAVKGALSLYNTGSLERGFANGYVDAVWSRYTQAEEDAARRSDISVPWHPASPLGHTISAWSDAREAGHE